jgi:hypothetical protein
MKSPGKIAPVWVIVFIIAVPLMLAMEAFAPAPLYRQLGGAGALVCIASLILFRSVEEIIGTSQAWASLPYAVAAFLVIAPVAIFASGTAQTVAWIVLATITGIAVLFWLVKIILDAVKGFPH